MRQEKSRPRIAVRDGLNQNNSNRNISELIVIHNRQGRKVGEVCGTTFVKKVSASKHFLRVPQPAIAWDVEVIEAAEEYGVTTLNVIDRDSSTTYAVSVERFWHDGNPINRGYGEQWALNLSKWTVVLDENQQQLF